MGCTDHTGNLCWKKGRYQTESVEIRNKTHKLSEFVFVYSSASPPKEWVTRSRVQEGGCPTLLWKSQSAPAVCVKAQ
jgi:hypothetical protein